MCYLQFRICNTISIYSIGDSIEHANDAVLAGKVAVIKHLVKIETK